jgi:hypothetical protein
VAYLVIAKNVKRRTGKYNGEEKQTNRESV